MQKNSKLESFLQGCRFHLGLPTLLGEWKGFFAPESLKNDLVAGLTVACVAIPLSLAIALASGVAPATGLVTAIVASIVCALFGGTPLAVSGPAAAMAVLVAAIVRDFGLGGLLIIGLGCGFLQLMTGIFGFGKLARFIPIPVITGFTAGIGAIILIGQLPRALGLPQPDESHVLDILTHIGSLISEIHWGVFGLTASTLALIIILSRISKKIPAALIAVILPSFAAMLLDLKVPTIGSIPSTLPLPKIPSFSGLDVSTLLGSTLLVYALASLESLLSSSAVDKLSKGKKHDPDQELIGQGLGNIASSLFGGIPVTGVIARSVLNVQAGARTRRSSLIHAFALLLAVYVFSNPMGQIPISVLSGVLISVALRMLHPREFLQVWRTSKMEGMTFLITFASIVVVDLIAGIQAGIIAALAISAIRLGSTQVSIYMMKNPGPGLVSLSGPITFLSTSRLESLRKDLGERNLRQGVIVDMAEVPFLDTTGALQLIELFDELHSKNGLIGIRGLNPKCEKFLLSHEHEEYLPHLLTEGEGMRSVERLIHGVHIFREDRSSKYEALFKNLAQGQSPHTLFITCSDSRIDPNLITRTDPGELFIVRNVGNLIPPFGTDLSPAEGAAIEFSIGILHVKDVVICGHSGCGAMKAILTSVNSPSKPSPQDDPFPSLSQWLNQASSLKPLLKPDCSPEDAAQINAREQVKNLKTYPLVREKLKKGELRVHAWFYDIGELRLLEWDETQGKFLELGTANRQSKIPKVASS